MEPLHMNRLRDLINRLRSGESERRIARDMGISRTTVRKYRERAEPLGYLRPDQALPDDATLRSAFGSELVPRPAASTVEPYREVVQRLVDQGVEMAAIFQRLSETEYTGSYSAVRRYVRRLRPHTPEAIVRVHTAPGEEVQVDFGSVGPLYDPGQGHPRSAYVFVATLCYSRHQYAEVVFDQKIPTWIGLHRRAFESFGGVPRRVVPDNLKPAVLQTLVYDPVLGEAYRRMGLHYGFLISPTGPGRPEHKGKVESGVHYVQRNFMAGQRFVDSLAANQHLKVWVTDVAGTRVHGTTHQAPLKLFNEHERAALLPLPAEPFTLCEIKPVKVHPDCHVTLAGSFYSVPYRYIGRALEAYVGERVVEIYQGTTLLATHVRCTEPGQWRTRLDDYPPDKVQYLMRTPAYCRQIAAKIGPSTVQVVETLLSERPLDRLRAVQGILKLEETVGRQRLEAACARALFYGDVRYRRIRDILNAALDREPLPEAPAATPPGTFAFARSATEFFASVPEVVA